MLYLVLRLTLRPTQARTWAAGTCPGSDKAAADHKQCLERNAAAAEEHGIPFYLCGIDVALYAGMSTTLNPLVIQMARSSVPRRGWVAMALAPVKKL